MPQPNPNQCAQKTTPPAFREYEILTLSECARIEFAVFLLNPPPPNLIALAAAMRYKAGIGSESSGHLSPIGTPSTTGKD
jgi:hypothetical protein